MTRSIRKRQKQLRKQAKPHTPHEQSPGYWRKEVLHRLESIDKAVRELADNDGYL